MNSTALTFMLSIISVITLVTGFLFIKVLFSRSTTKNAHGQTWTRIGLVLAMAGNAVGFGNFLRFPVQAIQNGGGAFIIPYLVCFLLMGIPLLFVEWSIGRYGGKYNNHSTPFMLANLDKRSIWKYVGVFGLFSNIGIAAYYCYIESWTLAYIFHSAIGTFRGLSQAEVGNVFSNYIDLSKATLIPYEAIVFYVLCLALNVYILSRGIKGIEKVSKIAMPLLILFGVFLAIKAVTLKTGEPGVVTDGITGLNFLWTPDYNSIWSPKVWLAAAGQIFFTLSVGMGSIQCYASFIHSNDDIALNSMSAGWMNEFVEVVLGAALIIPMSVGYLGIDKVRELAELGGLAIGFKVLPYLLNQWAPFIATMAGIMWFSLLFFAGITSSLAMGKPCVSFMEDEFKWSEKKSAIGFGILILILGMPTVLFFNYGVFDQYDYWTGTVSLFIFSLFEIILFSWVFGVKKGWQELNRGGDITIPKIYMYVLRYITPVLLIMVFTGALVNPAGNNWAEAFRSLFSGEGWPFDNGSIIKMISNASLKEKLAMATDEKNRTFLERSIFFINGARILLLSVFIGIALLVYVASRRRKKEGRV
ncbi:MAG: sodium-dependent transporter [Prolixibacteraceae bacterium]|jgi:SNF family Na+-dependent transporter|nr:sodium-dependent transporter [Prolixibacteraceae bacterium]